MTRRKLSLPVVLALFALLIPQRTEAVESTKLTDVVKSDGIGAIDLFRDLTAADLEAFRLEANGELQFAVDINEAASGSEKSSSQGVALETVELVVEFGVIQQSFSVFNTDTQALLAAGTSTERSMYYTLIGESGSSRITSNAIQDEFDAVIHLPVGVDLSSATSAVLNIVFLDTNTALGDPEAFYDYSNGFEDLALVTSGDATFFEELAPGQDEAPAVIATNAPDVAGWLSYPGADTYYTVTYEDSFPNTGDYDFNDLIVAYRVDLGLDSNGDVIQAMVDAYLIARGAGFSHDWRLAIPVAGGVSGTIDATFGSPTEMTSTLTSSTFDGSIDLLAFEDTRAIFRPPAGHSFTNTEKNSPFVQGPRFEASIVFDTPTPIGSFASAPFDPYMVVRDTAYEVHLIGQVPTSGSRNEIEGLLDFKDPRGYPFSFVVPTNWSMPWERIDAGNAYPQLSNYVQSKEKQSKDWYEYPEPSQTRNYSESNWKWFFQ
jgi:LruC domain-containing protein